MHILLVGALMALCGCTQKSAEKAAQSVALQTDNSATRYVGGLQSDVQQAHQSADKMNEAITQSQEAIKAAQSQAE